MRRGLVLAGIILVAIVGFLALTGGQREDRRADRDARALASLPPRDVVPMLALPGGAHPDLVIYEDGDDGWFELDWQALPETLDIGFHGPRIFDVLTGNEHVPLYCSGPDEPPGKIIWVIRNRNVAGDYAFCNRRRMNLAPLRPFASPVELVTENLPFADLAPLEARIIGDPVLGFVDWPEDTGTFTHRRVIVGPQTWWPPEGGHARYDMEDAVQAAILDVIGDGQVAFRNQQPSMPNISATVDGRALNGMAVVRDGQLLVLDGIWAQPYEIWVDCLPEACDALDRVDFDAFFARGRNQAILNEALRQAAVVRPVPEGYPARDLYADLADLEDASVTLRPTVPVTYLVRYMRRPEDA